MKNSMKLLEKRILHFFHQKRTIRNARMYTNVLFSFTLGNIMFTFMKKNSMYSQNHSEYLKEIHEILQHKNPYKMSESEWNEYATYLMEYHYR